MTPFERYLVLSGDYEYEAIDEVSNYYYGVILQPKGLGLSFSADQDFNWRAGLMVSLGYVKIAGLYIEEGNKFRFGAIVSAQSYESFMPKPTEETYFDF